MENNKRIGYAQPTLKTIQEIQMAVRMVGMEINLPALDLLLRTLHEYKQSGENFSVREASEIACQIKETYPHSQYASWSLILERL